MKGKHLVIFAIMVVGTAVAVGFVFWSNRNLPAETIAQKQKAENPCMGLSADKGEISCEEAIKIALGVEPGTVQNVSIGVVRGIDLDTNPPSVKYEKKWLVDIKLVNPRFDIDFKKDIKFLRVGIGLHDTEVIYKELIR